MMHVCWAGRSDSQRVEALLQRISDGALPEERQDAVAELRDVLQSNPEVTESPGARAPQSRQCFTMS